MICKLNRHVCIIDMWKLLTRLIGISIYKLWIGCGCAEFSRRMGPGMFRRRRGETNRVDRINCSHDINGDTEEGSHKAKTFKKFRCPKGCFVVVFLVVMIIVANYMGIIGISSKLEYMLKLSDSVIKRRLVTTGAVAADNLECSQIGRDILLRHGSAVDAAIATLLCCHNINPHSSGIGGSSMITIYDSKENETIIINAKAISPSKGTHQVRLKIPPVGPLSIGIPGEIRGYWEAHQRYGKLPWKELFAPGIAMLEKGVSMTKDGVKSTEFIQDKLSTRFNGTLKGLFPDLSKIFCYENGEVKQAGEIIHRLAYLQTLRKIAKYGADYLYSGEGAELLVADLQKQGSILTLDDLKNYQPLIMEPLKQQIADGIVLHTTADHSGGILLAFILKTLKGYNITHESFNAENEVKTYHLLTEIFKFSSAMYLAGGDPRFTKDLDIKLKNLYSEEFAQRVRNFIDPAKTQKDELYKKIVSDSFGHGRDEGTTHVSVLGPDGDAVSITSSINHYYGSLIYSNRTGIILNNAMFSFFVDGQYNLMEPGKIPSAGSAPSILFRNGDINLVIGCSGGDRIASTLAMVLMELFTLNKTLTEAIRAKRYFYDMVRPHLMYEADFPQHILQQLRDDYGHKIKQRPNLISAVQAIYRDPTTGKIIAHSDERKEGKACLVKQLVLPDIL